MATIIKPPTPPERYLEDEDRVTIFLAGSIEMGAAEDWQKKIEKALENEDCVIFNPRRDDWDSSWEQSIDNPQFFEQVTWELKALEEVDIVAMYLAPGTKSPISLLELGRFGWTDHMIVCCPEGFWRKGNVDIFCQRYNLREVNTLDELIEAVKAEV